MAEAKGRAGFGKDEDEDEAAGTKGGTEGWEVAVEVEGIAVTGG